MSEGGARRRRQAATLGILASSVLAVGFAPFPAAALWGEHGHRLIARAAVGALPPDMPAFFREAEPQLAWLNPEPDRWRSRDTSDATRAMNDAFAPEHYVDLELLPPGALEAHSRYVYMDTLWRAGVDPSKAGLLPFEILELTERLRMEFLLWRRAPNDQVRAWIEARIINDAGILGHYVADGSNPHHTTIHHNGWVGDNPHGYATDRRFHGRFEGGFVQARLTLGHVTPLVARAPRPIGELRPAVLDYLQRSHALVERLYQIDKRAAFDSAQRAPENVQFAAERLAAGAGMLRDLWYWAWTASARDERR